MANSQYTIDSNGEIITDIAPSVVTYTLPEINTPEGQALATKMANNIKKGTMDPNNIPNKYRAYIEATLNGTLAVKENEDRMRINPVTLTAGIEPIAIKGLKSNISTAPVVNLGSSQSEPVINEPVVVESENKPEITLTNEPATKSWFADTLAIAPTPADMSRYRIQQMMNPQVITPQSVKQSTTSSKSTAEPIKTQFDKMADLFINRGEFRIQLPKTNPIAEQLSRTPTGKHIFKTEGIDVKHMQALLNEAAKYGIYFRITSGYRKGAKTKSGKRSWHSLGHAIDVTPIEGQSWDDLKRQILNAPLFVKWMQDNGYGILDETTPEMLARTGGTGAHWHIGKDKSAIKGLRKMLQEGLV